MADQRALVTQWREEAQRLDKVGEYYYEGAGTKHPEEWIMATQLRACADALEPLLARQTHYDELLALLRRIVTRDSLNDNQWFWLYDCKELLNKIEQESK